MKFNKVIIAPDSFKGVLTAREVNEIIAGEISEAFPDCEIVSMPIADGGEGSIEAILSAIGGEIFEETVLSPDDRQISASYGISNSGVGIVEMAQSSGITRQIGLHPMTSNTYGFGQLILAALDRGVREFYLCIGGSASTDGGCGMASALGVRFTNKQEKSFIPCGETLGEIVSIDISGIDERIAKSKFTVMSDVDNPLIGKTGAAYVYGPQKGANMEQVVILDNGLRHYGTVLQTFFGKSLNDTPGAGAAGGLGAGCIVFLSAGIKSGIDTILMLYDFKRHSKDADLIITGEGKLDSQSFQGKVLTGILREAGEVPVWSICGVCDCDSKLLNEHDIMVFEATKDITAQESMKEPVKYLRLAVKRAITEVLSIKAQNI
ncbi:MAG: glycerate kinase [Oscillospiraceae bacterium]|jgi:glycerate kinase|nr:glycerate kinase [Oscillospiraceae bacterium]